MYEVHYLYESQLRFKFNDSQLTTESYRRAAEYCRSKTGYSQPYAVVEVGTDYVSIVASFHNSEETELWRFMPRIPRKVWDSYKFLRDARWHLSEENLSAYIEAGRTVSDYYYGQKIYNFETFNAARRCDESRKGLKHFYHSYYYDKGVCQGNWGFFGEEENGYMVGITKSPFVHGKISRAEINHKIYNINGERFTIESLLNDII